MRRFELHHRLTARHLLTAGAIAGLTMLPLTHAAQARPHQMTGKIENVAVFYGPMPTGVTVSHRGRIFVNYPRWGDPVKFTVAELRHGHAVPFPNMAWNRRDKPQADRLVAVQSVVVDPLDRLWMLDTGSVMTPHG